MYVTLLKNGENYYILTDNQGCVKYRNSSYEMVTMFENAYMSAHSRSYEGSMSACISHIMTQPSIIEVKDIDEISSLIERNEKGQMCLCRLNGTYGLKCISDKVIEQYEKGIKPKLYI